MNKQIIDNLIQLGDSSLSSRNYSTAFGYYEQSLLTLSNEALKDKKSKNISTIAGWTAAFLTGGIGFEDLIVIPGVSKGVSKLLGADENYAKIALQAICLREIDCLLSSEQLRNSVSKQTVLQRFAMLFRSMKQSTTMEKLFSLYIPDLAQSTPFEEFETEQPPDIILLQEMQHIDESKIDTAYLLYSYLQKISDSSELFQILQRKFENNSRENRFRTQRESEEYENKTNINYKDSSYYYKILGLSESATIEEIKNSYRELMKKYHPDRFSTLSSEFQELANQKAQEINEAYEFLIRKMQNQNFKH
jgi:hypothetical protein